MYIEKLNLFYFYCSIFKEILNIIKGDNLLIGKVGHLESHFTKV